MTRFDSEALYERMYNFGLNCQKLIFELPKNSSNNVYGSQLIRSSSSVGANYIESLEGFTTKDFLHKLRISRKEARESGHWLRLILDTNSSLKTQAENLLDESVEIKKILSSSILSIEKKIR